MYVFVSRAYTRSEVLAAFGDDGQLVTEMRTSDGFINATKMCSSAFTKVGTRIFGTESGMKPAF
jgi:hypothetical protein